MKVIIAGGGTGGHLYPGIAVAEKLREQGIPVLFMVSNRGIEHEVLTPMGYDFIEQDISAFKGVNLFRKATAIKKLFKAVSTVKQYMNRGDKVLLMGGFAAAPAAFAAIGKGLDIHIHEQNSVMGLLNKLMSTQARRIYLSYPSTKGAPGRGLFVGNPVPEYMLKGSLKAQTGKNLLITGGSGGSRRINMLFAKIAQELLKNGYSIYHQTGRNLYEETVKEYEKHVDSKAAGLKIVPYIDDMAAAYADADLVVCRAGSGTVFGVTYALRPAIYIPFAKATNNHQYYNASAMVKRHYAKMIEESELSGERMLAEIRDMFENIDFYTGYLGSVEQLDSAALIVKELLQDARTE